MVGRDGKYRPHPKDADRVICTTTVYRNVLRADLQSSDHYLRVFEPPPAVAETVPGTTAVGTSASDAALNRRVELVRQ